MIGAQVRIPIMTLLKILATGLVAVLLAFLAAPSFAANDGSGGGVSNGAPANPGDPAAKPRRHRKHHHHQGNNRPHRRPRPDGNPNQGPVSGGAGLG